VHAPWYVRVQGSVPVLQFPEWHHPGRHLRSHLAAVSGDHVCDAWPVAQCFWDWCPPGAVTSQLADSLVVCVGCRVAVCTLVCACASLGAGPLG
jgi:hypothetical protein